MINHTIKTACSPQKRLLQIFIVSLVMMFLPALIFAKTVTVEGTGQNRDAAISDALRNAVEQAVGTLVDSNTIVEKNITIKDEIYSRSQGFVRDFEVVPGSERRQGGMVILSVKATIDTEPNSKLYSELQRLNIINTMLRDPRIAVIIPETHLRRAIPDPAGETAVIRTLTDAGFRRIVDPQQVNKIRNTNFVKAALNGDRQEAINVALQLGADYIIIGEAFSELTSSGYQGSRMLSCRARVEARLIKADTGEIITAHGTDAGGVDTSEAVAAKNALNNAGNLMGNYMVEKLMAFASNPNKGLQLIVRNVNSFNTVNILQDQLKQVKGISDVHLREYSGGKVVIDLNYTGTPQTLANAMAKFYNISIRTEEISNSVVNAVIN